MRTQGKWEKEGGCYIVNEQGQLIADFMVHDDREFVFKAAILHDELVHVLEKAKRCINLILPKDIDDENIPYEVLVPIENVLAKAKELK